MSDIVEKLNAVLLRLSSKKDYGTVSEAADEITRLREENARLLAANKDLQLHFDVAKEDLDKANEENSMHRTKSEDWACDEITRLRRQIEAMDSDLRESRQHFMLADIDRRELREENARLRELLDDAFAQWDGDWPEELVARVKAVIGAEQATGGP